MFRLAILASTNGTDLQAIIEEIKAGKMPGIDLALVLSNKADCFALKRAKDQGYKTVFLDPKGKSADEYDQEMAEIIFAHKIDLLVLVGYMRILTPEFVNKFPKKIINVHPSLIPKYSGKDFFGSNVYKMVLKNQEKETGMTIHYVDDGIDTGEIILQKKCPVDDGDNLDSLKKKVQELEKVWYPEVIRKLAKEMGR